MATTAVQAPLLGRVSMSGNTGVRQVAQVARSSSLALPGRGRDGASGVAAGAGHALGGVAVGPTREAGGLLSSGGGGGADELGGRRSSGGWHGVERRSSGGVGIASLGVPRSGPVDPPTAEVSTAFCDRGVGTHHLAFLQAEARGREPDHTRQQQGGRVITCDPSLLGDLPDPGLGSKLACML